jgi:hypothetical protein
MPYLLLFSFLYLIAVSGSQITKLTMKKLYPEKSEQVIQEMNLESLEKVAFHIKGWYPIGIDTFGSDLIFLESILKDIPGKSYAEELSYILNSVLAHSMVEPERSDYLNGSEIFPINDPFDLVRIRRALRDHVAIVKLTPEQYDLLQDVFNEIDDCFQMHFCEGFNKRPKIQLRNIMDYQYLSQSFLKYTQASPPTKFIMEPFFFPALRKSASVTKGYSESRFNNALARLYELFNNPINREKEADDELLVQNFIETWDAISDINYFEEPLLNQNIPFKRLSFITRFVKLGLFVDVPLIRKSKCETKDILRGFDRLLAVFRKQIDLHIKRKEEFLFASIIEDHFLDAFLDILKFVKETRDLLKEGNYLTKAHEEFYNTYIIQIEEVLYMMEDDNQPAPTDSLKFKMDSASNLSIFDSYFDILPVGTYRSIILNHFIFELVNEFFRPIVVDPENPMDTTLSLQDWIIRAEPIQLEFERILQMFKFKEDIQEVLLGHFVMQVLFIYFYHRPFDFNTEHGLDDRFSLFASFFFQHSQVSEQVNLILVNEMNLLYEVDPEDTEEERNEKRLRLLQDGAAVKLMKFTAPYEQSMENTVSPIDNIDSPIDNIDSTLEIIE